MGVQKLKTHNFHLASIQEFEFEMDTFTMEVPLMVHLLFVEKSVKHKFTKGLLLLKLKLITGLIF